jgi:hypothetical protein
MATTETVTIKIEKRGSRPLLALSETCPIEGKSLTSTVFYPLRLVNRLELT